MWLTKYIISQKELMTATNHMQNLFIFVEKCKNVINNVFIIVDNEQYSWVD